MSKYLPQNLLILFEPRPPLAHKPAVKPEKTFDKLPPYHGMAQFVSQFEDKAPEPEADKETREERKERKRKEKMERSKAKMEKALAQWDPASNEGATSDAYKTLFVGRLGYATEEKVLWEFFSQYGTIKQIKMVQDKYTQKPRGYAFIEFEHEASMKDAYKNADGRKLEGRRILVDVERGRTVRNWKPRKFGGGLGGTRRGGKAENVQLTGRDGGGGMAGGPGGGMGYRGGGFGGQRSGYGGGGGYGGPRGPPQGGYGGGYGGGYRGGDGHRDRGDDRGGYGSRGDRYGSRRDDDRGGYRDRDRGDDRRGGDRYRDRERDRDRDRDRGRERDRGDYRKRERDQSPEDRDRARSPVRKRERDAY